MKNKLIGLGMLLAAAFATAGQAQSATVEEYDAASQEQRSKYMSSLLGELYNYYVSNGQQSKAQCMDQLYSTQNASGDPRLFTIIVNAIDAARDSDASGSQIQDLVYTVVERECQPTTDQANAAQPPAPQPVPQG